MSTSTINKELQIYNLSRGVLRSSIHAYRHTFITNAVNSNVNILLLKKITGHAHTSTLSGYYNNSKVNDMIEIIDNITPKNNKRHSKFTKIK